MENKKKEYLFFSYVIVLELKMLVPIYFIIIINVAQKEKRFHQHNIEHGFLRQGL